MAIKETREGVEHLSFSERVKQGVIGPEEARKIQKDLTGQIISRGEGESIIVKMDNGEEKTFQNAAEAADWVRETGGLIYRRGENEQPTLAYGQEVDRIIEQKEKGAGE